jgi:hypothetical protein
MKADVNRLKVAKTRVLRNRQGKTRQREDKLIEN